MKELQNPEPSAADKPTVSVVMPAYNAGRYIERSIRSVLEQTFEDLELLVVDDCSSDGTAAIVSKMQESDERIQLVRLPAVRAANQHSSDAETVRWYHGAGGEVGGARELDGGRRRSVLRASTSLMPMER